MQGSLNEDIVVIGAGIVGLAIAEAMIANGRSVLVIDRKGIAQEASAGNAGALCFSDIFPLASPGIIRKAPKWLLDPLGPLTIRPSYFLKILPWLIKFGIASRPAQFRKGTEALAKLNTLAARSFHDMLARVGATEMIHNDGSLQLYESEAEVKAAESGWKIRQQHDIAFEHVRGERLAQLQPGLAPSIIAATFVPQWQTVSDPQQVAFAIEKFLRINGAKFLVGEVGKIEPIENGARLTLVDGSQISSKKIIVAAGAWSAQLTKQLGDNIPLETERGYNTTMPSTAFDLRRQLIFGSHGFVATPLATGIRIGGAVEFGGLHLPPNFARSSAMLTKASKLMPGLKTDGGKQWMGFRPSLPDSLPVIGPSSVSPAIIYAFGHGHCGLTQSAATAQLVLDIVTSTKPSISLQPFSPKRFLVCNS